MCSGRIDLEFIITAFLKGHDGVFIGGCRLNECNYVTQGNYDALAATHICQKILGTIGLDPNRLKIQFMNASDGILLAEAINRFSRDVTEIGPLGLPEGIAPPELSFRLAAVNKLVPYIRLVERERLRVAHKSVDSYDKFFKGEEFARLYDELIASKIYSSQIVSLLKEQPRSTSDLSQSLGLNPSALSEYLGDLSMHGLVKYDTDLNSFTI